MSIADRMEEALDAIEAPEVSEHWRVEDAGGADWALRKLRKARRELADVDRLVTDRIAALQAFRDSEHDRIEPEVENWETRLELWHRSLLEADDSRKTVRLPSGTLTARKLPDGVEIDDPVALLDWALEHEPNRFVVVKESLDRAAVKAAVLKAGEIVPGVTPVTGTVRFSVDTDIEEVEG